MCARSPSGLRTFLELRYSEPGDAKGGKRISGYYAPLQRVNPGALLGVWDGAVGFFRKTIHGKLFAIGIYQGESPVGKKSHERLAK
jgi:hypothetical protein